MASASYKSNFQKQRDCLIAETHKSESYFLSTVILIKCRFDQISFQSRVISIKCSFNQTLFRLSVVLINCRNAGYTFVPKVK